MKKYSRFDKRIELLKAMNEIVMHLDDEETYYRWIDLVPDCATEEDFKDIAQDDDDMQEICDLFMELVRSSEVFF